MSVALKPKPMLAGAADAGAASRSTAAASTAGTSAMTFIFIFQVLPCCDRESVAHNRSRSARARQVAAEHQAPASVQTDRSTPTQAVRAAVGTAARSAVPM